MVVLLSEVSVTIWLQDADFSGSGLKHSPATGLMLAALALEQDDDIPKDFRADRYSLERFQTT